MVIKLIFSTKHDRPIIICITLIQINAGNLNEQSSDSNKTFFLNHHKIVIYDEDDIIIVEMISKK